MFNVIEELKETKKPPKHIADFSLKERKEFAKELGIPGFRADQVSRHWFANLNNDFSSWTDLPNEERNQIAAKLTPQLLTEKKLQKADQGNTVKTLWQLYDGLFVESVLMHYPNRTTICISSQAGCGMACPFCATGQGGLTRNLSTAEIVEQVLDGARKLARGEIAGGPGRVSNIVFMGMGEPMLNLDAVLEAARRLPDVGITHRRTTISTVGWLPNLTRFIDDVDDTISFLSVCACTQMRFSRSTLSKNISVSCRMACRRLSSKSRNSVALGSMASTLRRRSHCPAKFSVSADALGSASMRVTSRFSVSGLLSWFFSATFSSWASGMLLHRKRESRVASSRSLRR